MNHTSWFRLNQATFDFGSSVPVQIQFVANPKQKRNNTHITLLMGANGTFKSRILSSCVNLFRRVNEQQNPKDQSTSKRFHRTDPSERDLECSSMEVTLNGVFGKIGHGPLFDAVNLLPSRLLAIANLVRDRFPFVDWVDDDNPFYYYLGVRQASNLTTTGAMDSLVADAFLHVISDTEKYATFTKWVGNLFPDCELGLSFSRTSSADNRRFLSNPKEWVQKRFGRDRPSTLVERKLSQVESNMDSLSTLFDLIETFGDNSDTFINTGTRYQSTQALRLERLPAETRRGLGKVRDAISLASSLGLLRRPSLILKSDRWFEFMQLSSGEQNLLATGARLIGFAVPASLIIIDEPEVSLNVVWQQRYIELISEALQHAHGSHVLIASHSPYLIADLHADDATIVVVERRGNNLNFKAHASEFWGWGAEAILYEVLGLSSASNYHFSREMASVLKLIQDGSSDIEAFRRFLAKCEQLDLSKDAEPLKLVIDEIRQYYEGLIS